MAAAAAGVAAFVHPVAQALYNIRAVVCVAAVCVVLLIPSLFRRHSRLAHAATYAAVLLRLFLIRYPVFLVPDEYAFFSLQTVPVLSIDQQQVDTLKHDVNLWLSHAQEQFILIMVEAALALAVLCTLCFLYSRSLILWRTGLLCLSATWLREEPLATHVASKPTVVVVLSRAHDQLLDAAVLVR